jgi:3-hydroxyisobutyrate dehydrogenase
MNKAVAVLGTGLMGAPMARNIAAAGHDLRVWNRTRDKAEALADTAVVASSPAEAVDGADVVVTSLADGGVVDEVMRAAAPSLRPGMAWLQMSTVGIAWTTTLGDLADELDVTMFDAPVLGTRKPAEDGELTVLAAGPPEQRSMAQPIFDAVGAQTIWLDSPGEASRLKLVTNAWITSLTVVLAESMSLAEGLGVAPQRFLDAIAGGAVGAPYAQIKGALMIDDDYPTSFPVRLARKDAQLVLEAAETAGLDLAVATATARRFADADEAGHGEADMAAVRRVV